MLGHPIGRTPPKKLSDRYESAWSRNRRRQILEAHEYTGKQNHCNACNREYIRLWRKSRPMEVLPEHDFVSHWHCKNCRAKGSYINRRLRQELKDYLAGACRVRCDENGNRLRDEKGRFYSRVVILRDF